MKYLTEFRNGEIAQRMAREIHSVATRPWKIMEVCGGQTHSIIKYGLDEMLPASVFVSGAHPAAALVGVHAAARAQREVLSFQYLVWKYEPASRAAAQAAARRR